MPVKNIGNLVIKDIEYDYLRCTCGHEFKLKANTATKLTRCKWCESKEKHLGINNDQIDKIFGLFFNTMRNYEEGI